MPDNTRSAEAGRGALRLRWRLILLLVAIGACAGALAVIGDVFPHAPMVTVLSGGAASGVLGTVGELLRMRRERLDAAEARPQPLSPAAAAAARQQDVEFDSPVFVGREDALEDILRRFGPPVRQGARRRFGRRRAAAGDARSGPLVVAVTGEPGIGKSELASQVAKRVQHRFPDGRLRCDLFGAPAGTARAPRRPERVLAELLRSIDAAPQRDDIPLAALRRTWRTLTRGRRLLLILDDAEDFDQVEPLLPGGDGCAVLITSTNALSDARMYVHRHPLGPLSVQAGVRLLAHPPGAGPAEAPPGPSADLAEIARECGGRPLSLALCRGVLHNGVSTRQLLQELRQDGGENLFTDHSVATAFRILFRERPADEQLLLGRLAKSGLTSIAPWAAAALLRRPVPEAGRLLEELRNRHLLRRAPSAHGSLRYQPVKELNSILRRSTSRELGVAALERPRWSGPATVRAIDRLLAAYAWLAERSAIGRAPREWGFTQPRLPAPEPDPRLGLAPSERPADWFTDERQQIQACLKLTHSGAPLAVEWRLQRALAAHCRAGRVYWADWRAALERTSQLAQRMNSSAAYGISLLERAELAGNEGHHGRAVELAREARSVLAGGDERWEARAARAIGVNLYRMGDRDKGEGELRAAEDSFARRGERWWRARTRCNLGELHRFRGDYEQAHRLLAEARAEFADLGDPEQAAKAGLLLGEVRGHMRRDLEAWLTLRGVLEELEHASGGSWYRARCLRSMGRLDNARLWLQYDDCDMVLAPERQQERTQSLRDFVFRGVLGDYSDRAAVAALVAQWRRIHRDRVRRNLGDDHWPGCTAGWEGGGLPRWDGAGARRLRADQSGWNDRAGVARVEEAHRLLEAAGDTWGSYRTLLILGELRMRTDVQAGLRDMDEAAAGFARLGHRWWQARAWRHSAEALYRQKHYRQAKDKARLAKEGYQGLSNLSGRLRAQVLLGWTLSALGEDRAALDELNEARADALRGHEQGIVPAALLHDVEDARTHVVGEDLHDLHVGPAAARG
ncbi:AAA family ATPase [Streptomonospora sp. PA3]|uniref:tetratricopeptide repeat protein n=1 Tax=Streptomonospora sp. PA3 TaxID=2607326 RepID=UPI0012DF64B9|nr:tetratricopeptide repeat protein [Streptomonospora sp. PA3]MUL40737.1 AAA family ATPase [Streptomonospora sp. PA3]